jgi:hypothetical protein
MLMLLPESVLLGLFPQGLILSKPASWDGADDGVFTVDVSHLSVRESLQSRSRDLMLGPLRCLCLCLVRL